MPLQFRTLKIKKDGHIFTYDKYFLMGCVQDYHIHSKDMNGNDVYTKNPNLIAAFSKSKFTNTIDNKEDCYYQIRKSPNYFSGQETILFNTKEVVEFSFMENNDYTILIDIDDTIIDLLSAWCKWLNNKYNLCIKPEEVTDWDITKFFPTLNKEQVFEPLHIDNFWETVKPKDNAAKYVKQLIDDGFNVYFCTTTDYRNIKPKYEYIILKYFPFISWKQVIVANRKQMVKADFLIDDGVHNHYNGDYVKILMSAPHNRNYDEITNGMYRVENWETIYKYIKSFTVEDRIE